MNLYRCTYIVLYGYEDGIKHTVDDWIEVEAEAKPTKKEIIDTLNGNNLIPKLLISIDVYSITKIDHHNARRSVSGKGNQMLLCNRADRICPKNLKICCVSCELKKDYEACNGDRDEGCGNHELFINGIPCDYQEEV
jgi:hypothetical protein